MLAHACRSGSDSAHLAAPAAPTNLELGLRHGSAQVLILDDARKERPAC